MFIESKQMKGNWYDSGEVGFWKDTPDSFRLVEEYGKE
jgi:hypothetical protein